LLWLIGFLSPFFFSLEVEKEKERETETMDVSRVVIFLGVILAALVGVASSQSIAPAPGPTSDGNYFFSFTFY